VTRVSLDELSISIEVPEGTTVQESVYGDWAMLEGPGFSLAIQAFIPEGSAFTAEEARGRLSRDAHVTYEEIGERTWRFDYEMPDGTVGSMRRIAEPRTLDVGTSDCTHEQRERTMATLASLRWL
jgi:hypothetical protein